MTWFSYRSVIIMEKENLKSECIIFNGFYHHTAHFVVAESFAPKFLFLVYSSTEFQFK